MSKRCDCGAKRPGILWPWGGPANLPYVERCDECGSYLDDVDAAIALADELDVPILFAPDDSADLRRGYRPVVFPPAFQRQIDAMDWARATEDSINDDEVLDTFKDAAYEALLAIHRYLYPERYHDVPMYEWHAGTIEDVAAMVERALVNEPRARLEG